MSERNDVKASAIFSLGLILSSLILGFSFWKTRRPETVQRHISVKGFAERQVLATVGTWPIRFKVLGDTLPGVSAAARQHTQALMAFLKQKGFAAKDIACGSPELYDSGRNSNPDDKDSRLRYQLEMVLTVSTTDVALLDETLKQSQELLLKMNIPLVSRNWREEVKFLYTELSAIKPSMLQEATIQAQKAAAQFASDSNVQMGSLRSAHQGAFSIEDTHNPLYKRVRVVVHMDYAIQDGAT